MITIVQSPILNAAKVQSLGIFPKKNIELIISFKIQTLKDFL